MSGPLAILPREEESHLAPHPEDTARDQVTDASLALHRKPHEFLHFPWRSLDDLVGGISRGEVWFVGAFSGHGKTTFLTSALDLWQERGRRVFYMGLESKPRILRTHWACKRLDLDAGDVLSGKAAATWPDWEYQRKRIIVELDAQQRGDMAERVYFSPEPFVNLTRLRAACEQAADLGSDVLMVDHIDHIEPNAKGRTPFGDSVTVVKALGTLAQEHDLRLLVATQFNNDAIRGNRLGLHQSPQPTAVYNGGHKRQIADGMLGLYRPLKFGGVDKNALLNFRNGDGEPQDVCEPGTMAVTVMKHRLYGNREGKRAFLGVERGRVVQLPEADLAFAKMPRGGSYEVK